MDILLLFSILFIGLTVSIPVGISLGLATAITVTVTQDIPLLMLAQVSFTALDSFPLMAIPFFILAGTLMKNGGISKRLIDLAESMVGFITGGLAMVTTLACMFFSAISGSGPATVSAIGSFMIPAMKEKKYNLGFAAAITAAAGSIGVIIPPSIPFVIYGVVTGASVGDMFAAGIIPGVIIGIGLMIVCYYQSKKKKYRGSNITFSFKNIINELKKSIWALFVPIIILGGIYGGVFTPTEAAVVAIVYAIIVGFFIYKELNYKSFYDSLKEAALINGATTFMLALSMGFARYITIRQIPMKIASTIISFSDNMIVILLLINLFLLIVGCFIDPISTMIIVAPIFLPIVSQFGIHPVHFGLFMTVALATGFCTPPYGPNLFIASAVSGASIEEISKNVLPYIVVMIVCLLLFTFIPSLSMFLPNLLR
jgi:C4-dicarboxylate transporter DctM subunit